MAQPTQQISSRIHLGTAFALACFFVSGFTSLVCEICWIRKASLVFGATTHAVSTVVAIFFIGLAVGSFLFGRYTLKTETPIRVYAVLEIVLGVLVLHLCLVEVPVDSGASVARLGDLGAGQLQRLELQEGGDPGVSLAADVSRESPAHQVELVVPITAARLGTAAEEGGDEERHEADAGHDAHGYTSATCPVGGARLPRLGGPFVVLAAHGRHRGDGWP